MPDVYIGGRRVRLSPQQIIGSGGEADIYDVGGGKAVKLFKGPTHPDYQSQTAEQQAARSRLATHQKKLRAFPANLPTRVLRPETLATSQDGSKVVGYQMPLLHNMETLHRYGERGFRMSGISNQTVVQILQDLHRTVRGLHKAGVVIGDFNDLNVMVGGTEAHMIDADSFQFGPFNSMVFTEKFVDPTLCDPALGQLMLTRPHTKMSDWYAYAVMLMQSLLYVGPYGGIYRPKDPTLAVPAGIRPLRHITLWHPEVRYPKPATHYSVLTDELLTWLFRTFEREEREVFPVQLVDDLEWKTCSTCGTEHARAICPKCTTSTPATQQVLSVRGNAQAREVFRTKGVVLQFSLERGRPSWLYHQNGKFYREGGREIATQPLDAQMRFRIKGKESLIAKGSRMVTLPPDAPPQIQTIDRFQNLPMFDTNEQARFWLAGGQLWRDGTLGPKYMGDVLENQTLFWVGAKFGFGFYRAGGLGKAFVFDASRPGINDRVALAIPSRQLVDSSCLFGSDRCWFFTSTQEAGRTINRCTVITARGEVLGTHQAEAGDGSWLGTIRNATAAGDFLLAATDDGVVRVESLGGDLAVTKDFPDTTAFVDSGSRLMTAPDGLYVVSQQTIRLLTIK